MKKARLFLGFIVLFILKNALCPALLLELGYMTNAGDRNYISSESGQREIASKIMTLIVEAEKELILVSPYVKINDWDKMKKSLLKAVNKGVAITVPK